MGIGSKKRENSTVRMKTERPLFFHQRHDIGAFFRTTETSTFTVQNITIIFCQDHDRSAKQRHPIYVRHRIFEKRMRELHQRDSKNKDPETLALTADQMPSTKIRKRPLIIQSPQSYAQQQVPRAPAHFFVAKKALSKLLPALHQKHGSGTKISGALVKIPLFASASALPVRPTRFYNNSTSSCQLICLPSYKRHRPPQTQTRDES